MKVFIQKYYNSQAKIRFQVVCDHKLNKRLKQTKEQTYILCDDILTYEAAEKTALFYAKELKNETN